MSEWKEVKIADLCEMIVDCVNRTAPTVDYITPFKMIRTTNVRDGKIDSNNVRYVTEKTYNIWVRREKPQIDDIILTREAPVGEVGRITVSDFLFLGQRTMMYRANRKKINPHFLFYSFFTKQFKEQVLSTGMGSVVEHIRVPDAKEFIVRYPKGLPEQTAIASVLSSLDDKIDLLHRQNSTLEKMAETLFRQWFVEEAREEWLIVKLKNVCKIINGYAFQSETYKETGFVIVRTTNFKNHWIVLDKLVFIDNELAKSFEKYQLRRNDFLLVMVGASIGNYAIVTNDILPALQNQNMWSFRAVENFPQHFLNFAVRQLISDNLQSASGSAREFFQKGAFYEIEIIVPPKDKMELFSEYCENWFSKIEYNRTQIITLTALRDTLLPKLMSGEVGVELES